MRRFKYTILTMLFLVSIVFGLTACGNSNSNNDGSNVQAITIDKDNYEEYFDSISCQFAGHSYNDVNINVTIKLKEGYVAYKNVLFVINYEGTFLGHKDATNKDSSATGSISNYYIYFSKNSNSAERTIRINNNIYSFFDSMSLVSHTYSIIAVSGQIVAK